MGKVLERRSVYDGRVVKLSVERVRLPNGRETDLEVIQHPGASAILPFVSREEVLLIRQHRHCAGGSILEVPAGKLDPGEPPDVCALREVEEETGYRAGRLVPHGWIWTTPGFTDEKIHLFSATDLTPGRQDLDSDEVLQVERMPLAEALERAAKGDIRDAKTIATLFRAARASGAAIA
jgi:ADP-ribose pyrophosphatase